MSNGYWAIFDWAGTRIGSEVFTSFDDAWEYILGEMTDEFDLVEEDYQEYHVEFVKRDEW